MEVRSMHLFHSTARPHNSGWLVTTNLSDFGDIHAFAETKEEIENMACQNVCSFTDLSPDEVEINWTRYLHSL